uniref:Uncharacterized protein n=1 Tax=Solanum lycopersicum TaxID=4081 RepID=A0A3Q7FTJ6_SOLLC
MVKWCVQLFFLTLAEFRRKQAEELKPALSLSLIRQRQLLV